MSDGPILVTGAAGFIGFHVARRPGPPPFSSMIFDPLQFRMRASNRAFSNIDWNRTVPRSLSGLLCLYAFDIGLL
jgi:hypothetical protein